MAEQETSLSNLYKKARAGQEDLNILDPRSEEYKDLLSSCISTLKKCSELVDRLALFSTNEEVEDVSTSNLQYLGVDYSLAELTLKSYSPTDRKGQLNEASELLESFLTRLNEYSLLRDSNRRLFESYKDSRSTFRIIPDSANPEAKRNTKIKRFQDEKELKSQLKVLGEQSQSLNVDDEVIRKLHITELDFYAHQAFQSLDLMTQERQMLALMPAQPDPSAIQPDQRSRNGTNGTYSDRLDTDLLHSSRPYRGILDPAGRPLQPFTITSKRTDLKKGVFKSGHNLPTMSIDEYLEEERKRGGIIEGGGEASGIAPEADEDDERVQDAATMKARNWDEFVEANPKGAGNTVNRG